MSDPQLQNLDALFADAINAYLRNKNAGAFESAMQRALTRAHTAAYLQGTATRLNVSVSALKGLSRAERADLQAVLSRQFKYLRGFAAQLADLSTAQIAARAALYAASAKASYWQGWAGKELECVPGNCPNCYSNCRCHLEQRGTNIYWYGPGDAHSCRGCKSRIGKRVN